MTSTSMADLLSKEHGDADGAARGGHRGDVAPLLGLGVPALHGVEVGPTVVTPDRVHRALQHTHTW